MAEEWNERDFVPRAKLRWHERNCPDQWERYRFAERQVRRGQRVLDIACGSGYGTHVLSGATGVRALGLDLAPEPVRWAQENFGDTSDFRVSGAEVLASLRGQFDVVVSFETLEHMPEVAGSAFLDQLADAMRPGGLLVLSTPLNNGAGRFSPANPYHVREYSWVELADLVGRRFRVQRRYSQISRLGRLREFFPRSADGDPSAAPAPATRPDAPAALSLRGRLVQSLRSSAFWRRGSMVEREAPFGGVQVVVAILQS